MFGLQYYWSLKKYQIGKGLKNILLSVLIIIYLHRIEFINMEKALLPKLWKVIKAGGNGNAAVIYPHLLPLLAKLNKEALGDKLQSFYTDFFKNTNLGLIARSTSQSRSDISAIATAYFECLQYVIIQIQRIELFAPDSNELYSFCTDLVQEHLVEVIAWCLNSDSNCGKHIFAQISVLLNYWTQNQAENVLYTKLLQHFWEEVYSVLEKSLENDERLERTLNLHFELVQCLRSGQTGRAKNMKVKFTTESDEVDSVTAKAQVKLADFNELAYRLCSIYMKRTTESICPIYIDNLENLFKCFANEEFFKRLSGGDSIFKLYDKLSVWLLIAQLRQENVVDIILQLYPYLNANEKAQLLNKLVKFPNDQVQSWVIARLLSHPLCIEPNLASLLAQPNVTKVLLKCATSVIEGETKENINFLHKCFFQNESGDILIDGVTCRAIIEVIAKSLNDDSHTGVLDTCASFLAQIMPVICSDEAKKDLQHYMFLKFFEFSVVKSVSTIMTLFSFT